MLKRFFLNIFKNQFVYFLIPLALLFVFGYFFIIPFKQYAKEVLNFILVTCILFSLVSIVSNNSIKKWLLSFSILLLHFLVFIKLSFYYQYGARINASTFYLIFETNKQESVGFLKYYFNYFVIFLALVIISSLFLYFNNLKKRKLKIKNFIFLKSVKLTILFFVTVIMASSYIINNKFIRFNLVCSSISAFREYKETKALIEEDLSKPFSNYVTVDATIDEAQTHVVIIGETISRRHMSLYGYKMNTNPLLNEMKKEFYVFNDIISPNTWTMTSLDKILTFSDYKEANKVKNTSIVQLANQAGFETYWLSNQQAIGMYDSVATQIAHAANNINFLAKDDFMAISYDEVLFDKLEEIIKNKNKKKIVFLHLMGAHQPYEIRYPESYNYFKGEIINPDLGPYKNKIINYYDNAILYNDYIVSNIINEVKKLNTKSSVIYFSDHGEDVYASDKNTLKAHNELIASIPMYEIPFIIWLSEDFKTSGIDSQLKLSLDRKYNLEDFPHTFSDLINIEHSLFDSHKSLISKDFRYKKRLIKIIGEEYNYDSE